MRLASLLLIGAALLAVGAVVFLGAQFLQPDRPLLADVRFSHTRITPNADGRDDATEIRYTLSRTARVTVAFTDKASGTRFNFREEAVRPANAYSVLFSGVVDGYTLDGESFQGTVERRLMPNGLYTWEVLATDENGEQAQATGELAIEGGDTTVPDMLSFDLTPTIFTPNQDGYDDRININIYLAKAARLTVYMQGVDGTRYYIPERVEGRKPGDPGARVFDYDGGVDNNTPPPPDGDYTITAVASDDEGQRVVRTARVTLKDGGLPNGEIVAQSSGRTVTWESLPYSDDFFTSAAQTGKPAPMPQGVQSTLATIELPQNDLLLFRLTISNYSRVPLRTIGPWPGTVYQYEQTNAAMQNLESREAISGAWRVGVECERSESSYPWRWAIGSPDVLTRVERENETLWYLMPGERAEVWGAIRMTRLIPTRNPQKCYAALIHEDVAIPPQQNRIGAIDVKLSPR